MLGEVVAGHNVGASVEPGFRQSLAVKARTFAKLPRACIICCRIAPFLDGRCSAGVQVETIFPTQQADQQVP